MSGLLLSSFQTDVCIVNDQVKEDVIGGACSTIGKKRNTCRILVGKLEAKRPLGRPRRRWVNNIKMGLRQTG
jgi:hypothetical protein